jgi:hypothetical protein
MSESSTPSPSRGATPRAPRLWQPLSAPRQLDPRARESALAETRQHRLQLRWRFERNSAIRVFCFGLATKDGNASLVSDGASTTPWSARSPSPTVGFRAVGAFSAEEGWSQWNS